MVFSEVEKIYNKSSIMREACEKKPIAAADKSYLLFKTAPGYNASYIEALPLGNDGSKIRGSRFYMILIDELVQVNEDILDLVIRPMGATKMDPMENVRRIEKQKRLIDLGLASDEDFTDTNVNKMIMTSSGFYKFNHMWKRMRDHWYMIDNSKEKGREYAVWQVPHWDLPEGFLDTNNIKEAERVMSSHEFRMEYCAEMISDSEGFFVASLLESCSVGSGFSIETVGMDNTQYVMGIDPNQGGSASCGIVIVKIGVVNHVVNVIELVGNTAPDMTRHIQSLCKNFNIVKICMDEGGGGRAIMDLLDEGYDDQEPIINIVDENKRNRKGRHILDMIKFAPTWISEANFTTLSMLENKRIKFPEPPTSVSDSDAKIFDSVNRLKSQMLNIEVTQTSGGVLHFDTPKKGQNKDLYSAMILACYCIKSFEDDNKDNNVPSLYGKGGFFRSRENDNWISADKSSYNPIIKTVRNKNDRIIGSVIRKILK